MDADSDISAALDLIADFCTQSEEQNDSPFEVVYEKGKDPTEAESKLINEGLNRWVKINSFKSRLHEIIRDAIKYGDVFFLRDPETGVWLWQDCFSVAMVKVDEAKEPEEYIISNFEPNLREKYASKPADLSQYRTAYGNQLPPTMQGRPATSAQVPAQFQMAGADRDTRLLKKQGGVLGHEVLEAKHVIHLALTTGMDPNAPFGKSVLEPVYKTFRQREMLEDAALIYRIQRAPERRVFYIDTGEMSPNKAQAYLDQIKHQIHQRRIPNKGAGGAVIDSAYNTMTMVDDYYLAQSASGRGSKVETLPGGDVTDVSDLMYFAKKMVRSFQIPPGYLDLGDDSQQGSTFTDGKLGTALIHEFRFTKRCMRIQGKIVMPFDEDFKRFLSQRGVEPEVQFELQFRPPQNFSKYRQIEMDQAQVGVYQQVADNKHMSERFKFERFLNLTKDEILENERLWREENSERLNKATGSTPAESDPEGNLGSVGVAPPPGQFGDDGFDMPEPSPEGEGGDVAADTPPPVIGGGAAAPETPPA